eukprot:6619084-Pyramimonas_sp.AAC.1
MPHLPPCEELVEANTIASFGAVPSPPAQVQRTDDQHANAHCHAQLDRPKQHATSHTAVPNPCSSHTSAVRSAGWAKLSQQHACLLDS